MPLSAISRRDAPADPAELFRLWLQEGWHIATSRTSRKGRELAANPKDALNFYWNDLKGDKLWDQRDVPPNLKRQ